MSSFEDGKDEHDEQDVQSAQDEQDIQDVQQFLALAQGRNVRPYHAGRTTTYKRRVTDVGRANGKVRRLTSEAPTQVLLNGVAQSARPDSKRGNKVITVVVRDRKDQKKY